MFYLKHETVKAGRYEFDVFIEEKAFNEGMEVGRMEDMPGISLKAKVTLLSVDNPSPLEALAAEKRVVLRESSKEITREPPGYAALWGDHFLQGIKSNPAHYVRDLQQLVKNAL